MPPIRAASACALAVVGFGLALLGASLGGVVRIDGALSAAAQAPTGRHDDGLELATLEVRHGREGGGYRRDGHGEAGIRRRHR